MTEHFFPTPNAFNFLTQTERGEQGEGRGHRQMAKTKKVEAKKRNERKAGEEWGAKVEKNRSKGRE